MSFEAWTIFALFWAIFVVTPGPNAVNCITNGITIGFKRGLWAVLAILTQSMLFLSLSAAGITALIVASPMAFQAAKLLGAAFLIYLGIRGWIMARRMVKVEGPQGSIYWRAFAIATINPKSVAGYLAAFSQFVQPGCGDWNADVGDFPNRPDAHLPELCDLYCAGRRHWPGGFGCSV